jgi:formylglycine-generating enzyme required for sulfatase activity/tRNA A-37 threonylcarbamoyl transferase component Bud32
MRRQKPNLGDHPPDNGEEPAVTDESFDVNITREERSTDHIAPVKPSRDVNLPAWCAEDAERYKVVSEHARGGLGRVMQAIDRRLDRPVAVKELLGKGGEARFVREAFITAQLQHPSIVPVHDLGRWSDGKPYYVMKMVSGRSLADLIKERSSLDERLALLPNVIAVAEAMAYAHTQRIIHRDLKPSNILIGEFGETVVVDWGIAADLREATRSSPDITRPYQIAAASLTLDGAVMGTAAYMPSEQALGKEVEEPADVYAIGAILYHVLAGIPPYHGNTSTEVLRKVISVPPEPLEHLQPGVPSELTTIVRKAMAREARDRYQTASELAADLKRFQTGKLVSAHRYSALTLLRRWAKRHRAIVVSVTALLLAVPAVYFAAQARIRRNHDAQVQALVIDGSKSLDQAREKNKVLEALRKESFFFFDNKQTQQGEQFWEKASLLGREIDALYSSAGRSIEAALSLNQSNGFARALVADVLYERAQLAEAEYKADKRDEILERLPVFDDGSHKAKWKAPGKFDIESIPTGAQVRIQRYREHERGNPSLETVYPNLSTPIRHLELPQGSYLLLLSFPGRTNLRFPLLVRRGEVRNLSLELPTVTSIPKGFVYIPPGSFLFGSSLGSNIRKDFLFAVPLHEVSTGAFLIAEHETTFGEWLGYLNALSPAEASKRSGEVSGNRKGELSLRRVAHDWQLTMRLNSRSYVMRQGDIFHVPDRETRQDQNWRLLPMVGVSMAEIEDYLAWLQNSNSWVRPRLCNEFEWEKAARGVDGREYPHGSLVLPGDANYVETYGRNMATAGPDEIGVHPRSRSPYGIDDMCGNVAEFTQSSVMAEGYVLRGGAFADGLNEIRSTNRQPVSREFRSLATGLRLCADLR